MNTVYECMVVSMYDLVAINLQCFVCLQVTNMLFKKPGQRFGMDLASFNMQRGREFGLPGYMEFR